MGYTSWSDDANQVLSRSYKTKSTNQVFTQNVTQAIANDMSPVGVQIRESRDSDNHPTSLAVAVFLDITGSMGRIPELIIRNSLGNLFTVDVLAELGIDPAMRAENISVEQYCKLANYISDNAPPKES